MIQVTLYIDPETDQILGFHTLGHAEYKNSGFDIICSAVSALVITTINSIEQLAGDEVVCFEDDESGEIEFNFTGSPSEKAELLLQSMVIGLTGIRDAYGKEYLNVNTKEV